MSDKPMTPLRQDPAGICGTCNHTRAWHQDGDGKSDRCHYLDAREDGPVCQCRIFVPQSLPSSPAPHEAIWFCKVGGMVSSLPNGADLPMRQAIRRAFREITGSDDEFCFSGWGATLTEGQRAVVENRAQLPAPLSSSGAIPVTEYAAGERLEGGVMFRASDIWEAYETGAKEARDFSNQRGEDITNEMILRACDAYVKVAHLRKGKRSPLPSGEANQERVAEIRHQIAEIPTRKVEFSGPALSDPPTQVRYIERAAVLRLLDLLASPSSGGGTDDADRAKGNYYDGYYDALKKLHPTAGAGECERIADVAAAEYVKHWPCSNPTPGYKWVFVPASSPGALRSEPTDTERLDWLENDTKTKLHIYYTQPKNVREAIDIALAKERTS